MAIQGKDGPVPSTLWHQSFDGVAVIDPSGSALSGASEGCVSVPDFDPVDPAQPGKMRLIEIVADAHSLSHVNNPHMEKTMQDQSLFNVFDTAIFSPTLAANAARKRVREEHDRAKQIDAATASSGDDKAARERAVSEIDRAQKVQRRAKTLRSGISLVGFATGAGGVSYGIFSMLAAKGAAEAAAAAAIAEGTVTAATAETVLAGEVAATTGLTATLTASRTMLGMTLPVWGWGLAAAGVAAAGYGIYRLVKSDEPKAEEPKEAKTQEKSEVGALTVTEGMSAFVGGAVKGATSAAALVGIGGVVGVAGAAVIGKSVAVFGPTYGPAVAIGGSYLGANMAMGAYHYTRTYFQVKTMLKNAERETASVNAAVTTVGSAA